MDTVRPCGCKGIRSCLICEREYNISKANLFSELQDKKSYSYCPLCNCAFPGWNLDEHPGHIQTVPIHFPGVYIKPNFLTNNECSDLIQELDKLPWDLSQSGRRKQNYGPKCNFKKRKLEVGSFNGFPSTTKFIQERFQEIPILRNFETIEQCSLEYTPERGASIDPHIDDGWIWGERIVTVNVLGDSVLTMTKYDGSMSRYNLDFYKQFPSKYDKVAFKKVHSDEIIVRLPMPAGSLMVLHGPARYAWEHSVLREDISHRRLCLAYREFTEPYFVNGTNSEKSVEIINRAKLFW